MDDTDTPQLEEINPCIADAQLPPETMQEFEQRVERTFKKYGHLTKSHEDCTYLAMLPLSDRQQKEVVEQALMFERMKFTSDKTNPKIKQ